MADNQQVRLQGRIIFGKLVKIYEHVVCDHVQPRASRQELMILRHAHFFRSRKSIIVAINIISIQTIYSINDYNVTVLI